MKLARTIVFLMAVFIVGSVFFTQPGYSNQILQRTVNEIIENDPEADIFMLDDNIYYRGDHLDWVRRMDSFAVIIEDSGSITKRYEEGSEFENGMASKLPIGSVIHYAIGISPKPFVVIKDQYTSRTNIYVLLDKAYQTDLVKDMQLP